MHVAQQQIINNSHNNLLTHINQSKLTIWAQHRSVTLLRHARRNASHVRNIIVWFSKTNLKQ